MTHPVEELAKGAMFLNTVYQGGQGRQHRPGQADADGGAGVMDKVDGEQDILEVYSAALQRFAGQVQSIRM